MQPVKKSDSFLGNYQNDWVDLKKIHCRWKQFWYIFLEQAPQLFCVYFSSVGKFGSAAMTASWRRNSTRKTSYGCGRWCHSDTTRSAGTCSRLMWCTRKQDNRTQLRPLQGRRRRRPNHWHYLLAIMYRHWLYGMMWYVMILDSDSPSSVPQYLARD